MTNFFSVSRNVYEFCRHCAEGAVQKLWKAGAKGGWNYN
jgi:hypothetical protein